MGALKTFENTPLRKLRDATEVGELVSASGSASRYVCVAITPIFKVAARILNGSVSVRVEAHGKDLTAGQLEYLGRMGLEGHGTTHASAHTTTPETALAIMMVTSVITGASLFSEGGEIRTLSWDALRELPGKGA